MHHKFAPKLMEMKAKIEGSPSPDVPSTAPIEPPDKNSQPASG